jgi:hypothetical protein
MHQSNMAITSRTRLLKLLLTLLRRLAVPVLAIHIRRDDAVAQVAHRGQHVAARCKVRRTHVGWLDADDVDEGLLEARHLTRQVGRGEGAEVLRVRPCVRGDLVAGFVGGLERGFLVVDAALSNMDMLVYIYV